MRKVIFAIIAALIMLTSTGISAGASGTMPSPEPPMLPKNPEEGVLYRLPDCDPLTASPNQPCFIEIFSNKEDISLPQSQKGTMTSPITTRCGVNVTNMSGTLLAKLWQEVRVAWEQIGSYYFPRIYWTSRGTWTKNWTYTWNPLTGPYLGGGSTQMIAYQTDGTIRLLGIAFGYHRARTQLWEYTSPYRWDCNGSY